MKRVFIIFVLCAFGHVNAQTNDELTAHFKKYYEQMRKQADVQGIINAITHLNILEPSQPRRDTLSYLYANAGKYLQALNTIGYEKNPQDSELAVEVKAVSLKSIGQASRALEQYEILFGSKPNPFMAYEMADLSIQLQQLDKAGEFIEYGITNAKDDMKYGFYETQVPYEVPLKAAFLHLKALLEFNKDQTNNIDSAIAIMNEALAIAPNFNLAQLSRKALEQRKSTPNPQNNN